MIDGPRIPPAAGGKPQSLVVFLHGYGADGNDLIGLGREWARALPSTAFVSPNAPELCPGTPMGRQWFPLTMRDPQRVRARRGAGAAGARRYSSTPSLQRHGLDESRLRAGRLQPGHDDGAACRAAAQAPARRHSRLFGLARRPGGAEGAGRAEAAGPPHPRRPRRPDPGRRRSSPRRRAWRRRKSPSSGTFRKAFRTASGRTGMELGLAFLKRVLPR